MGFATAAGALLLVLLLAAGASSVAPLRVGCAPGLDAVVCERTVVAALERGLAPFHPLILSAFVEPGEVPRSGEVGHRATVTFDLLGVPGPTTVALYYDIGAHWGGVPSRGRPELAAWAVFAAGVMVGVVALVVGLGLRVIRRGRRAPSGGTKGGVRNGLNPP